MQFSNEVAPSKVMGRHLELEGPSLEVRVSAIKAILLPDLVNEQETHVGKCCSCNISLVLTHLEVVLQLDCQRSPPEN